MWYQLCMATDKLVTSGHREGWRVEWVFADKWTPGYALGVVKSQTIATPPTTCSDQNDENHIATHAVAQVMKPARDRSGFVFDSKESADGALAIARGAIKAAKAATKRSV